MSLSMSNTKPVALVIGASRGMGRQIAISLAEEGYTVVVAAKTTSDPEKLASFPPDPNSSQSTINTVVKEIHLLGGTAIAMEVNTRSPESVSALFARVSSELGRLDVLVYNSGAIWWSSVANTPVKRFKLMQEVNIEGLYSSIQASFPLFEKGSWKGRIVVVCPPIYSRFFRGKTAYAVGKVGMSVLVKGLSMDWIRESKTDVAITGIWPAVAIESAATQGAVAAEMDRSSDLRKATVFSDAILAILGSPTAEVNGLLTTDEDFLRDVKGVTDFGKYSLVPGIYVPDNYDENLTHAPSVAELSEEEWVARVEDEISQLLDQINVSELEKRASILKGNVTCSFKPSNYHDAMMGNANYHAWLIFDDGDRWLVRTPRTVFCDIPQDMVEYFIASEFATLKFLESTKVPAPRAFGFGLASDENNAVGVSYLLMECLPGKPFNSDLLGAEPQLQRSILAQFAEILIDISKHPVSSAGSLIIKDGQNSVSKIASNRFVHLDLSGPFFSASDYFTAISDQYLDLVADGQVYSQYPTEAFAFYSLARREAQKFNRSTTVNPEEFFLKHVDDKGDHLLLNDQGIITGIIDWQFARFVPAIEAFGPSYLTANLNWLYSSNTGITTLDKQLAAELRQRGADNLARHMESNEIARRFHHGLAVDLTKSEAREILEAWRETLDDVTPSDLDSWIAKTCDKDPRWEKVLQPSQS
ncbi:short chain dehydrogenase, partial [Aureobasidium melanogenum]